MSRKKTGLLGGTFDPLHIGHLIIAEAAFDAFGLDDVILMPSGHSYFKDDLGYTVTPSEIRLKMTQLGAQDNPHFKVSDMEVLRPGNSYTCETIEALCRENPDTDLYYIIGADTVLSIPLWKNPEVIFENTTILAALREDQVLPGEFAAGIEALRERYHASVYTLEIPNIGISSSDIRKRVKQGRSVHYQVPNEVERYIIETGLYRGAFEVEENR